MFQLYDKHMTLGIFSVLAALLFWLPVQTMAAGLGPIEVASNLNESFYAEVPVQLDASESISEVIVELASPADRDVSSILEPRNQCNQP